MRAQEDPITPGKSEKATPSRVTMYSLAQGASIHTCCLGVNITGAFFSLSNVSQFEQQIEWSPYS